MKFVDRNVGGAKVIFLTSFKSTKTVIARVKVVYDRILGFGGIRYSTESSKDSSESDSLPDHTNYKFFLTDSFTFSENC